MDKIKKADVLAKANIFEDRQAIEKISKELETDFIPDMYDKSMGRMFGDKYYENEVDEDSDEAAEIEANKNIDLKLAKDGDLKFDFGEEGQAVKDEDDLAEFENALGKERMANVAKNAEDEMQEEGDDMWFCCDMCMEPIPEGMLRFDCT